MTGRLQPCRAAAVVVGDHDSRPGFCVTSLHCSGVAGLPVVVRVGDPGDDGGAHALWEACAAERGLAVDQPIRERHIGDAPETRELLLRLILSGEKTMTCTSPWLCAAGLDVEPTTGGLSILLDSTDRARAVLRTTHVTTMAWRAVTGDETQYEGKSVRPIAAWRAVHWRYLARRLAEIGRSPSEEMPITFERFEVLCRAE